MMEVELPEGATKHEEENLYNKLQELNKYLEFLTIQEEYIKEDQIKLKREEVRSKEELKRIQAVPLVVGHFVEMIDENHGLVTSTGGTNYYVRVLSTIDREKLKVSTSIAMHRHSYSVVDILPSESDAAIQMMQVQEKPDVSFSDIGGLDTQKQELKEAVELPLTYP